MPQTNEKWGAAIRSLLNKHKLTLRGAETKTGGAVTRTYISEWTAGKLPQYTTALAFLEHFPREEAIECLEAGGFPVPPDWQESDPVKAAGQVLFRDMPQNLQGKAKEMVDAEVEKELERIREKYAKKFQN